VAGDDPRLVRLSAICLDLPEAKRELSGRHAGFRVRGRTFAYFVDDTTATASWASTRRPAPRHRRGADRGEPERFHRPAHLGHRGWVGLRLDADAIDWDEVTGVVVESFRLCAPKSLARAIDAGGP
jgi:hypothetical protein